MSRSEISAVVLAGGYSSRMGKNKAELRLDDESFIEHQISLIKQLGISDIMISGSNQPPIVGTRLIGDIYPHRGPLSGIHAGLVSARYSSLLVIAVDNPLLTAELLEELLKSHESASAELTILSHKGILEPLIGVYSKSLAAQCERILTEEKSSVRKLIDSSKSFCFEYAGDERLLMNCNTAAEYEELIKLYHELKGL